MAVSDRLERKVNTMEPQGEAAARAWHALPVAEIFAALGTGPEGLASDEAEARKLRFGPNRLPQPPKRSEMLRFLQQFHNLLIYVLIVAAGLAASIGHFVDAAVVLGVVILNAIIGYVQEGRAERALEAISAMIDPRASVIRDGRRESGRGGRHRAGRSRATRARRPGAGGSATRPDAQSADRRGGAHG